MLLKHEDPGKEKGYAIYLVHSLVVNFYSAKLKESYRAARDNIDSNGRRIIEIPKFIQSSTLQKIIDYMYSGEIDVSTQSKELILAIGYFEVPSLDMEIFDKYRTENYEDNISSATSTIDKSEFLAPDLSTPRGMVSPSLTMSNASLQSAPNASMLRQMGFDNWSSMGRIPQAASGIEHALSSMSIAGDLQKTPVSALQEFMQKDAKPIPVYNESNIGPPFTVICTVDGQITEGTGNSKKEAKHKAAEQMLQKLAVTNWGGIPLGGYRLNRSRFTTHDSVRSAISSRLASEVSNQSSFAESSSLSDISNTVGYLQEMMQKGGHPIPQYAPGMEYAAPFSCKVTIHTGETATGTGANKAKAKSEAARQMLFSLQEKA